VAKCGVGRIEAFPRHWQLFLKTALMRLIIVRFSFQDKP
jgi:hypothetical protein